MRPAGVLLAFCALAGCFSDDPPELTGTGPTASGDEATATASTAAATGTDASSTTEEAPTSSTSGTTAACPMGQMQSWYVDGDGDSFGAEPAIVGCEAPPGTVDVGGDCDDADPEVNPDASELCNELVDDDCDGLRDEYSLANLECGPCKLSEFGAAAFWTCLLPSTFADAETWCQSRGAAVHLADPINGAELGHVRDAILGLLGDVPAELHFWLGLQRAPALWDSCELHADAVDWVSATGGPIDYLVWRLGEPDNQMCDPLCAAEGVADAACPRENCVEAADPATGEYNDRFCDEVSVGHVCKAPLTPDG
ncbi:MopE-related protein [Nannocystis radixulma]|uniref:MopE-related protein n=1 Tax=Nannocystis radixulma TaxID=2995305 RepID=A0ABT5BEC9_9BACT|nr:MopE-related protein [Nannocystis radixulma]MDC0672512.1 MopE-related protein [Nannocystis radixulma]